MIIRPDASDGKGETEPFDVEYHPDSQHSQRPGNDIGNEFDELSRNVGSFGRYQQVIVFLVLLPAIFAYSYGNGFWLFVIATPEKFWCRDPVNGTTAPTSAYGELSLQCDAADISPQNANGIPSGSVTQNLTKACQAWEYEATSYYSTIVTEWDLVCDKSFFATFAYIVASIVGTLAAPVGGWCSDHYGRKRTYFFFLLVEVASGIAVAFAPNYWFFLVFACLHNVAVYPTYQALYTLGVEILVPEYRTSFVVLFSFTYALGAMSCCGVAYMIREWRSVVLACTVPVTALLGFWWIIPESPRFNLTHDRFEEAERYLRRVAKWNRRPFNKECREKSRYLFENISAQKGQTATKNHSFKDLFLVPKLCKRTCLLMLLSTLVAVSFYGLAYYAPQFGTNPYLNVFLTSVVDLPAALLTQLVADRLGRRLTLIMDFLLGGLVCLATLFFPQTDEFYAVTLTFFLLARMFAVSSYTMEELVSCENFPTVLRGEGISLTNGVSGVVSNLGPLIVYWTANNETATPMAWFGGITVIGCVVMMFVPETVDLPLPETLEDFQDFTVIKSWREITAPVTRRTSPS